MKAMLVTGGAGFIGANFVRHRLEHDAESRLIVLDRLTYAGNPANLLPVANHPRFQFVRGDIVDQQLVTQLLERERITCVVHFAAESHVDRSIDSPDECIRTNVFGAENVVYAALRRNVRKVIALSTDKAANPVNLYGASKLASDKIFVAANNLAGADGTRFSVVRYGNVAGSREPGGLPRRMS